MCDKSIRGPLDERYSMRGLVPKIEVAKRVFAERADRHQPFVAPGKFEPASKWFREREVNRHRAMRQLMAEKADRFNTPVNPAPL
jgi:hypothetical protein